MSLAIAVIGDSMLDHYIYGDATRISPEAPVPVIKVEHELFSPGGAAHVAASIQALNQPTILLTPVGLDDHGKKLLFLLGTMNVTCVATELADWKTPVKTRVMANGVQMLRYDCETPVSDAEGSDNFYASSMFKLQHMAADLSGIVVSDYSKGAISNKVVDCLRRIKQQNPNLPLFVDCKPEALGNWDFADVVTPNFNEACKFLGGIANITPKSDKACEGLAKAISDKLPGVKLVVVTRAQHGCSWYGNFKSGSLPAFNTCKADVIGAGDTFISALSVAFAAGKTAEDAIVFANAASAIAVGKGGTTVVHRMELDEYLTDSFTNSLSIRKIKNHNSAIDWARQLKATGEKIVFANGCFDLLHSGHVYLLEQAKASGSKLIVAVNDDESIKLLKGSARPIVQLHDRLRMIAALESVDCVVHFSHHDLEQLVENIKPDLLVKGSEYANKPIPGASVVEKYGGKVMLVDMQNGMATTKIIEEIRKADSK